MLVVSISAPAPSVSAFALSTISVMPLYSATAPLTRTASPTDGYSVKVVE
ncbi:secreted protein [marine sediment metagenome]|uniref:Secreted protein n=1 Tax=marine sediment metagenome TaxID=412755 RepID=A0A1B6NUF7_9ZZZZ